MKMNRKTLGISIGVLCSCLLVAGIGVTYAGYATSEKTVNPTVGSKRVIYLSTASSANWRNDNPKFSAYVWADGKVAHFVNDAFMETVGTNLYRAAIPTGYTHVLFVRHPTACKAPSFTETWNQTEDLAIENDVFTVAANPVSEGGKFSGSWSAMANYTYTSAA